MTMNMIKSVRIGMKKDNSPNIALYQVQLAKQLSTNDRRVNNWRTVIKKSKKILIQISQNNIAGW